LNTGNLSSDSVNNFGMCLQILDDRLLGGC